MIYNDSSAKAYPRISYYRPTNSMITDSNLSMPFAGRWQAELLSTFQVEPFAKFKNEDWHRRNVVRGFFNESIYAITLPKNERQQEL
jgi:hypothetical protein